MAIYTQQEIAQLFEGSEQINMERKAIVRILSMIIPFLGCFIDKQNRGEEFKHPTRDNGKIAFSRDDNNWVGICFIRENGMSISLLEDSTALRLRANEIHEIYLELPEILSLLSYTHPHLDPGIRFFIDVGVG